ncbi:hypothetical protein NRIC_10950 [Enterococcus florum]|uniref:Mga helix-turn-helix domain-containing protein n=1 Tax=Enterococcus florum TaxID=2480627 RepID=A0A4P5PA15_9ENTE|nr:helix-turn-helix domain-containing protein [Enterococcus florum]GCF93204.1 hypothetical protein NRIC_10950 [Enterococcus florum]
MNFRSLLGASVHRYLLLIEELYYSKKGVTFEELQNKINCSTPVLLSDIKYINSHWENFTIHKKKGIYTVEVNSRFSIRSLYSDILESSPEFQIIEQLLYEDCENIHALANHLFLSFSNTQRYLKKIGVMLKKIGLHLSHRPLRIEGNEMMIRQFYLLYFLEKYDGINDQLPKIEKEEQTLIENTILGFFAENNVAYSYMEYKRTVYSVYIALWRGNNGHILENETLRLSPMKFSDKYVLNEFQRKLRQKFKNLPKRLFFEDCLWRFSLDIVILNDEHHRIACEENPTYLRLFLEHVEMIDELEKLIGHSFNEERKMRLVKLLTKEFYLYEPMYSPLSILREARNQLIDDFSTKHECAAQAFHSWIEQFLWKNQRNEEVDSRNAYLYLLLTTLPEVVQLFEGKDRQLNVLLLSDLNPSEEECLLQKIYANVYGNYTIHLLRELNKNLNTVHKKACHYDCVLTTYSINGLPKELVGLVVDFPLRPETIVEMQKMFSRFSLSEPVSALQNVEYSQKFE